MLCARDGRSHSFMVNYLLTESSFLKKLPCFVAVLLLHGIVRTLVACGTSTFDLVHAGPCRSTAKHTKALAPLYKRGEPLKLPETW